MRVFVDCRQTVTPNKTESTAVISLLSIRLTPSRSERRRRRGAFTVIKQKKQRSEGELRFDGQCDEGAQPGAPNGDVHLSFYATYSRSEHSRREEGELPDKGKFRGGNWQPGAVACPGKVSSFQLCTIFLRSSLHWRHKSFTGAFL